MSISGTVRIVVTIVTDHPKDGEVRLVINREEQKVPMLEAAAVGARMAASAADRYLELKTAEAGRGSP